MIDYSELIAIYPKSSLHYRNRSACYMMLGKYQLALNDAKKSLELDAHFIKAHNTVIQCYLYLGDITQAETALTKLSKIDPNNTSIATHKKKLQSLEQFLKAADAAYNAKDFDKAARYMRSCCSISTSCERFKLVRAEYLAFSGCYKKAEEIAYDVLNNEEKNVYAQYVLGICLYFQDIDKAFEHFQQILELDLLFPRALRIYVQVKNLKEKKEAGNTAYKMKQYEKAYKLYSEALKIDPQNIVANAKLHFNKATVAAKLGRPNEAITECTEALKLNNKYLKALLRRAESYMRLKKFEDAVCDLKKVCEMDNSPTNQSLLMAAQLLLNPPIKRNHYSILGINKNASYDEIRKAYKKKAKEHHPDQYPHATQREKKEHENKFKEVGAAYAVLSDHGKRLYYDYMQKKENKFRGYPRDYFTFPHGFHFSR
ncbi:tetratricopeptide repeat protein 2 isoform X2 [Ptiloglossa arizonensis]